MKLANLMIGVVSLLLAGGCGKSSSGEKEASGNATTMSAVTKDAMSAMTKDARRRAAGPMRPANAVTDGPTGIAECDQALDVVCRCAKREASLRRPCKTLQEDAPRWKTRARNQDPKQLSETRQACARILEGFRQAYGCK